ncbi:hypothetical protein Pmani_000648 [Petrolisthes manimaculis]|uniref:Uncharacterized protein n=1 Tax=Petrolisthes manimaculis TaxID=1843537 RepID=A0AAE1QLN8_9EUCA|nr:hypothetical protein Pmani_000648 [Petrolisthes manimaculis]
MLVLWVVMEAGLCVLMMPIVCRSQQQQQQHTRTIINSHHHHHHQHHNNFLPMATSEEHTHNNNNTITNNTNTRNNNNTQINNNRQQQQPQHHNNFLSLDTPEEHTNNNNNTNNTHNNNNKQQQHHNPSESELVNRVVGSLDKTLQYYENNYAVMNFDGILGAKVVEGQLNLVVAKYKKGFLSDIIDDILKEDIAKMASRAGHVVKLAIPDLTREYPDNMKRLRRLLQLSWDMGHSHHSIDIALLWSQHTRLLNQPHTLNEIESDHCMSELLEPMSGMMCSMTEGCQELMTRAGFDKYALTHQILYTVVAEMSGCGSRLERWLVRHKRSSSVEQLQAEMCSNLHLELVTLAAAMFTHNNLAFRDLFLEMEFVCGMLGYTEFLERDWLVSILGWQSASGCFPASRPHFTIGRKLLEEKRLPDGCLSHLTSVAASTLAVHLHYLLFPGRGGQRVSAPSQVLHPPRPDPPLGSFLLPIETGYNLVQPLYRGDVPSGINRVAEQEKSLEDKADIVMQHLEEKQTILKSKPYQQSFITPALRGKKATRPMLVIPDRAIPFSDYLASTELTRTPDHWFNPLVLVASSVVLVVVVMARYVHAKRRAHTLFRNRFRL